MTITTVGTLASVPVGARGRGIDHVDYANSTLRMTMTDGSVEVASMPIGGGMTGGDPATSIPLTQEVVDYVAGQLVPIKATDDQQTNRLDSIDASLKDILATEATDAELAKAIADLSISSYLLKSEAATLYAPISHVHPIAEVTGLQSKLDSMDAQIAAATGQDMSQYVTHADADATYATKTHTHVIADVTNLQASLDAKISQPSAATDGQVLTRSGSAWVAATPAAADTSSLVPKSLYTAKGSVLVGSGASTPTTVTVGADGTVLTADSTAATGATWKARPGTTYPWAMTGTLTVKTGTSVLYNDSAAARTITAIRATVGTAPAGSGVTVALKVNGAQVATVTIAAGATTAVTTGAWTWPTGQSASVDVTAVGSTTAGSDLTVGVVAG